MAVKNLFASTNETFKVVSRKDDALAADLTDEEYAEYLKDFDDAKLRRANEEPFTYFHLRLATRLEDELRGKNSIVSLGMNKGGDTPLFTVMTNLVRTSLIDVTCDGQSLMRKNGKGEPADELLLGLVRSGIILDLFAALQAREGGMLQTREIDLTKKN